MGKYRAIPQGFMTVGELAKKMNTTVRTLQYYDKEGVLASSSESEGGRRLYTDKDVILLHQIQSMKYLGFSLDDIKNRLISLDSPQDIAVVLAEQAKAVQEKIGALTEVLQALEKLREETLQMQTVDFKKYADIVVNLQMKNEFYGLIKYFDDTTLDHIRDRFTQESGKAIMDTMSRLLNQLEELQQYGISPESPQGQALAKAWWDMVTEFTGGDMTLIPGLMKFAENSDNLGENWSKKWLGIENYLQNALEVYFTRLGVNPFEEV